MSEDGEEKDGVLSLVNITQKALELRDKETQSISIRNAKSGAEYFAARTFQGLEIHNNGKSVPEPFLVGRSGKASGYKDEKI